MVYPLCIHGSYPYPVFSWVRLHLAGVWHIKLAAELVMLQDARLRHQVVQERCNVLATKLAEEQAEFNTKHFQVVSGLIHPWLGMRWYGYFGWTRGQYLRQTRGRFQRVKCQDVCKIMSWNSSVWRAMRIASAGTAWFGPMISLPPVQKQHQPQKEKQRKSKQESLNDTIYWFMRVSTSQFPGDHWCQYCDASTPVSFETWFGSIQIYSVTFMHLFAVEAGGVPGPPLQGADSFKSPSRALAVTKGTQMPCKKNPYPHLSTIHIYIFTIMFVDLWWYQWHLCFHCLHPHIPSTIFHNLHPWPPWRHRRWRPSSFRSRYCFGPSNHNPSERSPLFVLALVFMAESTCVFVRSSHITVLSISRFWRGTSDCCRWSRFSLTCSILLCSYGLDMLG